MALSAGFLCFNSKGTLPNHVDIAPRFGGVIYGITNTFVSLAGSLSPLVTGYFTNKNVSTLHDVYKNVDFLV